MSADTYAKKSSFSGYQHLPHEGVEVFVAQVLPGIAERIHLRLKRLLFFKTLSVLVEPVDSHIHGPA